MVFLHKFIDKYKKELLVLLFIVIGVGILYGNTLKNGFVLDDVGVIQNNTYVHSLQYLPKIFTGCIWETVIGGCKAITNYYRPLQNLSYMLTYQISPNPWSYALVRMIYFAMDIFLVFLLIRLLTKNFIVSLFSALIFLINPVNSEAVNFSAPDLLFAAFILLATIFYFKYRLKGKSKNLVLASVFYGLGIFTKETAILTPIIFLTLDLTYFRKKISWFFNWKNVRPYLIFTLTLLFYFGLRILVVGGVGVRPEVYPLTFFQRVGAFFYLFYLYVVKFFFPYPLQFSYPPIGQSLPKIISIESILSIVVAFTFVKFCIISWEKKCFSLFFGLIWFAVFLFLSIVFILSLNTLGGNAFTERYVFVPGIGFSLLIGLLLGKLWQRKKWKQGIVILLGAIFLVCFAVIFQRNEVWNNNFSMYTDALQKYPGADIMRYNLASYYQSKNDMVNAKKQYGELIKRGTLPYIFTAYSVLANIYYNEKNFPQALHYFQEELKISQPKEVKEIPVYLELRKESLNSIGAIYTQQSDMLQSIAYFCKALLIDPNYKDANTNFNYVSSQIQGLDNKSFTLLHNQMLEGTIFKPARIATQPARIDSRSVSGESVAGGPSPNKATITLQNKDCSYQQGCILTFNANLKPNEFLFPFLIYANTPNNQVVRIRYSAFNQGKQGYQIALGIDHSFGNTPIHFYIPSCSGVYYETQTP